MEDFNFLLESYVTKFLLFDDMVDMHIIPYLSTKDDCTYEIIKDDSTYYHIYGFFLVAEVLYNKLIFIFILATMDIYLFPWRCYV